MAHVPASGGPPSRIEIRPQKPNGVFGPFILSDLESALAAYALNQGQASGPQNVSIVLNGPVVLGARLPPLQIVSNQQAGGESFLLADLQNALAAYKQNQGQQSGTQLVSIYSLLDDSSGGGNGGHI